MFCESFCSKLKACGGVKSKNRHPSWLYCTMVGLSEAGSSHRRLLYKKAIFKNFAISTGNTCVGVCFWKSCRPSDLEHFKKGPQHRCFPVNIAKFLIPILKNICKQCLFNFFNVSLLHRPKALRSRLYDSIRHQGPSYRYSFCF